jgi:hypothetical protein
MFISFCYLVLAHHTSGGMDTQKAAQSIDALL